MGGEKTANGFSETNPATQGSSFVRTGTVTGKTAANCDADFPVAVIFDSMTGPWLHGLLVSWDGLWLLDGPSVCWWQGGGSAVPVMTWAIEPTDSARQKAPHSRCMARRTIMTAHTIFMNRYQQASIAHANDARCGA